MLCTNSGICQSLCCSTLLKKLPTSAHKKLKLNCNIHFTVFPHQTPIHGGILTSTPWPQSAFASYPWHDRYQAILRAAPHTNVVAELWYRLAVQFHSLLLLTEGLLPAIDWWTERETLLNSAGHLGMHKGKHFLLQIKKKEKQGGNVSINPNVTLEPVVKELDSMFLVFFLNFFFVFKSGKHTVLVALTQ